MDLRLYQFPYILSSKMVKSSLVIIFNSTTSWFFDESQYKITKYLLECILTFLFYHNLNTAGILLFQSTLLLTVTLLTWLSQQERHSPASIPVGLGQSLQVRLASM